MTGRAKMVHSKEFNFGTVGIGLASAMLAFFVLPFSAFAATPIAPFPNGNAGAQQWTKSGSPYVVNGSVYIRYGTLSIEPGVVVKFGAGASLTVHADVPVTALGTAAEPIYFTSLKDDSVGGDTNSDGAASAPASGDWGYVDLGAGSVNSSLQLEYVKVHYGGGVARSGGVDTTQLPIHIDFITLYPSLVISYPWYNGSPSVAYTLQHIEVAHSPTGALFAVGPNNALTVSQSSFFDTTEYGAYQYVQWTGFQASTGDVAAAQNWWGDPSGPHHPTQNPTGTGAAGGGLSIGLAPWLTTNPVPDVPAPPAPQTFGYSAVGTQFFQASNVLNATQKLYVVPEDAVVTSMSVYVRNISGVSHKIQLGIYKGTTLIGHTGDIVTPPGNGWSTASDLHIFVPAGTYYLGWESDYPVSDSAVAFDTNNTPFIRQFPVSFGTWPNPIVWSSIANDGTELPPREYSIYATYVPATTTPPQYAECCSSVMFLPGIEGSVLRMGSNTLWPPTLGDVAGDLNKLALNSDGTSQSAVTVDGVLNNFNVGAYSQPIYQGFSNFMDSLVADHTIHEWKPMPYDWRFAPDRILASGILTPNGILDLVNQVEQLAQNSDTGKVTIVGHSMGGLTGKALIKELENRGEANLIDSFIMVGSPQLGTPQAVGALLHGEGSDISWFGLSFINKADSRALARNMESSYNLLPSPQYYANVIDPPIVFDTVTALTKPWRDYWGIGLIHFADLFQFLSGDVLGLPVRSRPLYTATNQPEVLREDLLTNAAEFHNGVDSMTFPANIHVVQIAGWGLPTIKGLEYVDSHGALDYVPRLTEEGDNTVVYSSAVSSVGQVYFFNLAQFNAQDGVPDFHHPDLLSAAPIQSTLSSLFKKENVTTTNYIVDTKPTLANVQQKLLVSVHSPVAIGAYDSQGRFTGIAPNQDPNAEVQRIVTEIPGSQYLPFGEGKYILLPEGGAYTFAFKGTGTGVATINIDHLTNDVQSSTASYSDIPVTTSTSATLAVTGPAQGATIQMDQNGDGQVDTYVAPDGTVLSLDQLMINLTTAVQNANVSAKVRTQLLNKIAAIQKKIDKQKQKQSDVLAKLKAQLQKNTDKGKIDVTAATDIGTLLDALVSQSATIPLDPALITQLQEQINSLTTTQSLKNSLFAKVTQLQNLAAVSKSLASMTQTVVKKGSKGQMPDADVQSVLNLLDQIQNAI